MAIESKEALITESLHKLDLTLIREIKVEICL